MLTRTLSLAAVLAFLATPVWAGHCPKDVKAIDAALAKDHAGLPLWVSSGSPAWASECPVLGVERKSISGGWMSPCSQEATFRPFRSTWILGLATASLRPQGDQAWNAALLPYLPGPMPDKKVADQYANSN